jgi:hypothetical protein
MPPKVAPTDAFALESNMALKTGKRMTEVPKIVYDRLRAARPLPFGLPGQAHPDADLLTALAERSLSTTERDGVLHHLASCGDCREIISLALPAAEIPALAIAPAAEEKTQTLGERQPRWTGRLASKFASKIGAFKFGRGLQWAALAAGVVVAASVLALYPGRSNRGAATNGIATNTSAVSSAQVASSSAPASATAQPPPTSFATSAESVAVQPPSGRQHSAATRSTEFAANKHLKASTRPSANFGANLASETTGQMSTVNHLMARNDAPAIEKAKPALQSAEAEAAGANDQKSDVNNMQAGDELKKQVQERDASALPPSALASTRAMSGAKMAPAVTGSVPHEVQFAITGGVMQRSLDGGQSWQNSLRLPSHPLICYTNHGEDIWAGGQVGTLFHSRNGGFSWVQVQPSIDGQRLFSDIIHIDVQSDAPGATNITLSTVNKETWISVNGGHTWEKK